MCANKTNLHNISEGIDRKLLKDVKDRFLAVNSARLKRTREALTLRQQLFFDLIPLLFHVNHPMLPGYVSHSTPHGVANYIPSKEDVQNGQRIARSFNYFREPIIDRQIDAIYLMGSCGTIAHSTASDLDIWICYNQSLTELQLVELRQKGQLIEEWAANQALEVHFFFMEGHKFRYGKRESLSTEDCGSAQHFLLLDEFYRTALLIAGRPPIWWLVPSDFEPMYEDYSHRLESRKYIHANETIDFGDVARIPPGEFVGAGIWQLYKGIESPYKSALKLMLIEVYASEHPELKALCRTFKEMIFDNIIDIDELDPYILVYRRLESYLRDRNELDRLELVRRCLYFKVGKRLSRPPQNRKRSWQRNTMERLTKEWGWTAAHIHTLDSRNRWKALKVMEERKALVRELTNSYRFLSSFARENNINALINSQEMSLLGRKLYAVFERRAGKIDLINPGIAPNLSEEHLSFCQRLHRGQVSWTVFAEQLSTTDDYTPHSPPLKRSPHLMELLVWCHLNGILTTTTQLDVFVENQKYSNLEVQQLVRVLQQLLPTEVFTKPNTDSFYEQAAYPVHYAFFINVGLDPMENAKQRGFQRLSDQNDSLDYSGLHENLILSVDYVTVNSWHEVITSRFEQPDGFIQTLKHFLQTLYVYRNHGLPKIAIHCFCPTRASAIAKRTEEVFSDLISCYYGGKKPLTARYVLSIENYYHVLQYDQEEVLVNRAKSEKGLIKLLGTAQQKYSPIMFDRYISDKTLLSYIVNESEVDNIQVFYLRKEHYAEIYFIDEKGSLFSSTTPFKDELSLLGPLYLFIQSTLLHQWIDERNAKMPIPSVAKDDDKIKFYEVTKSQRSQRPQINRRPIPHNTQQWHSFMVQAIGEKNAEGEIDFSIYCDQLEFSPWEWGETLYTAVAEFILSRRAKHERYPCYITDLDLSRCFAGEIQTVQYLKYKQQLEQALNRALHAL